MKDTPIQRLKKITTIVYFLQAMSFLSGITLLIAVIINYVKQDEVQGTWLESHFKWQIKTFWLALLGIILGLATLIFGIGFIILTIDSIWVIYRIIKGWLLLMENRALI